MWSVVLALIPELRCRSYSIDGDYIKPLAQIVKCESVDLSTACRTLTRQRVALFKNKSGLPSAKWTRFQLYGIWNAAGPVHPIIRLPNVFIAVDYNDIMCGGHSFKSFRDCIWDMPISESVSDLGFWLSTLLSDTIFPVY